MVGRHLGGCSTDGDVIVQFANNKRSCGVLSVKPRIYQEPAICASNRIEGCSFEARQ